MTMKLSISSETLQLETSNISETAIVAVVIVIYVFVYYFICLM